MSLANDDTKVRYSPLEQKLLDALGKRPKSSVVITKEVYSNNKSKPRYPRQVVVCTLANLSKKVRDNRESFEVCQSVRQGPHPALFWIEKGQG